MHGQGAANITDHKLQYSCFELGCLPAILTSTIIPLLTIIEPIESGKISLISLSCVLEVVQNRSIHNKLNWRCLTTLAGIDGQMPTHRHQPAPLSSVYKVYLNWTPVSASLLNNKLFINTYGEKGTCQALAFTTEHLTYLFMKLRFSTVRLCSIGKRFWWVRLCLITEANRSKSNDWSSIEFDYRAFDCSAVWLPDCVTLPKNVQHNRTEQT